MRCKHCGEDNGHWDCEYWHCDNCGENSSARAFGFDLEGMDDDCDDEYDDCDEYDDDCDDEYDDY